MQYFGSYRLILQQTCGTLEIYTVYWRSALTFRFRLGSSLNNDLFPFTGRACSLAPTHTKLKPLKFEIVHQEECPVFVGRDWFFKTLELELCKPPEVSRGVAIVGPTGSGKTAILEQIMEHSCHGDGQGGIIQNTGTLSKITHLIRSVTYGTQ